MTNEEATISQLIKELRHPDAHRRKEAAILLGQSEHFLDMAPRKSFVAELAPLLRDEDSHPRRYAAQALGNLGFAEALSALEEAARVEENGGVLRAIGKAILSLSGASTGGGRAPLDGEVSLACQRYLDAECRLPELQQSVESWRGKSRGEAETALRRLLGEFAARLERIRSACKPQDQFAEVAREIAGLYASGVSASAARGGTVGRSLP